MQRQTLNPHVLVAEDDVPLANFLRRQLESEAYNVHLVQDGEAASEQINSDKYHLLILDLNLPMMSGMEVLGCMGAEIRDQRRTFAAIGNPAKTVQPTTEADRIDCHQLIQLIREFGDRLHG